MYGRYHQMSGNGCLNRDLRRLLVSDLSHHDDVRILSKEGTKSRSKGQAGLDIDLYLIDTGYIGLHRIFYCHNVNIGCI